MEADRSSKPAWNIRDAIGYLLDDLERRYEAEAAGVPSVPPTLSSGVAAFDQVCGGGLAPGRVTIVEAKLSAQALALLCSIANSVESGTVLDVSSALDATASLLANRCGVPAVLISTGCLSVQDWDDITAALQELASRNLWIGEATSLPALERLASTGQRSVLLIHDLERFGPASRVVPTISRIAELNDVAVVASCSSAGNVPFRALENTTKIAMIPCRLASGASFVRPDARETPCITHVEVDCLSSIVR